MTSPPYWGLRTYKTEPQIWDGENHCEHEWGSELIKQGHRVGETNPGKEGYSKLYLRLCLKHSNQSYLGMPMPEIKQWALDREARRDPITGILKADS